MEITQSHRDKWNSICITESSAAYIYHWRRTDATATTFTFLLMRNEEASHSLFTVGTKTNWEAF